MRRTIILATALLLAACARLPSRAPMPDEVAIAPATAGVLAERVDEAHARYPGLSGFRLVAAGTEAYALRAYSAQAATRALDIQTYIWHDDPTGRMLARQALQAADRGVRVRILVDDLDARAKNGGFAALDAHPNVAVRLYNPTAHRGAWGRLEFGTRFGALNHRMHNKSWIADNRIALVGGRNLGDEYFNASPAMNFIDLDVLMAGPVVQAVSDNFDRFWNSPSNYPIGQLAPAQVTPQALARLREVLENSAAELAASPYARVLREDAGVQALLANQAALHWTADWRFVSDDPMKAQLPQAQRSAVLDALLPAMRATRRRLWLISPYFVPGKAGTQQLVEASEQGRDLRVLTNSLSATDVAAVHGGYTRYRRTLLAGGVGLWELKPAEGQPAQISLKGSSGSSLHTKAAILDDNRVFVGSYNLDPRSTSLNCEQGVLVGHPALAAELAALFERQLRGDSAWQVNLAPDGLRWSDGQQTWTREPDAPASRRFMAWWMKVLPVESQL